MATLRADLIKETTATTGTGTVTLSAISGWARFSNAFSVSDVVPYIILDANGNKETGFGTVGASNTLARTTPSSTLVGSTYDNTTPTAITLSGSATVLCGPIAALTVDTANIAADAVTYAKIQNVSATDKLLGRSTAGAGDVEEITCTAAGRALIDDADAAAQRTTLAAAGTAVANTFTANQTIQSTDAGATGPVIYLDHNSASPAASDNNGIMTMRGRNSSASSVDYLTIVSQIVDPTAGSEDSKMGVLTMTAGAQAYSLYVGAGTYTPNATGGDKGIDTINAKAVYDDNVLLTCYAIEAYKTGTVDAAYWDDTVLDLEIPAQPALIEIQPGGEQIVKRPAQPAKIEVQTHAPATRFAERAAELLDPAQYATAWKATGHLPAMPSPAEWEAAGRKMALGDVMQRLWETVECQAIHIDKLLQRIEALGG